MANFYRDLTGWLSLLPALAGIIVCAAYLRRSRWVPVLLAGFGLELLVSLFYRLVTLGLMRGSVRTPSLGLFILVASVFGLVARFIVIGGLAGVLADLRGVPAAVAAEGAPPPA